MSSDANYTSLDQRITNLEKAVFGDNQVHTPDDSTLNWGLNERAFVSRYVKGMTGTEKFVLLIAFLAGGDVDVQVSLGDIEKLWGKMTAKSLLGMKFNRKYTTDAKTQGWVQSPTTGKYQLAYGWNEIIKGE